MSWIFIITNIIALVACIGYGEYVFRKHPNNRGFLNSIPSFSTGIGVLLTFVVLLYSLGLDGSFTGLGMGTGSNNTKSIDILDVVPKLVGAFSTSIIGVLTSLIYGIRVRLRISKLDEMEAVGKPYITTHPNELLYYIQQGIEILNSENEGLKGAINGLKSSNEVQMKALSEAINHLVQNVNEEVKNTVATLQAKLESYIGVIGQNAIDTSNQQISTINQQFLDDTQGLIKANQVQLSEQFGNLEGVFKTLVGKIEGLSIDFNTQTNTTQTAFNNAVNTMTENLGTQSNQLITHTQNQLGTTIEKTNAILTQNLDNLEKTFSNIEKWQNTSKLALEEVTKEFVGAVTEYQSIGEQNKAVLDEVEKQLAAIEQIRETEENILNSISHYDKMLEDSKNKVDDVYNAISKLGKLESRLAKLIQ
jgi:hypothetical protein